MLFASLNATALDLVSLITLCYALFHEAEALGSSNSVDAEWWY